MTPKEYLEELEKTNLINKSFAKEIDIAIDGYLLNNVFIQSFTDKPSPYNVELAIKAIGDYLLDNKELEISPDEIKKLINSFKRRLSALNKITESTSLVKVEDLKNIIIRDRALSTYNLNDISNIIDLLEKEIDYPSVVVRRYIEANINGTFYDLLSVPFLNNLKEGLNDIIVKLNTILLHRDSVYDKDLVVANTKYFKNPLLYAIIEYFYMSIES